MNASVAAPRLQRAVPHSTEHGAWFLVGVPWAAAMAAARAPVGGWLLLPVLLFAVLAREPLLWVLWARRRHMPPPAWGRGALFGVAAAACGLLWVHLGAGALAAACLVGSATLAALDVLARVVWSKPTAVGGLAGALAGGLVATAVLASGGRSGMAPWVIGACLAYALGVSSCAMHLFVQRVPRRAVTPPAAALLWGWTLGAGALVVLLGLQTSGGRAAAAVACLGLVRAEMARRQPRTIAFRRLGWREGLWLAAVGALVVALAP